MPLRHVCSLLNCTSLVSMTLNNYYFYVVQWNKTIASINWWLNIKLKKKKPTQNKQHYTKSRASQILYVEQENLFFPFFAPTSCFWIEQDVGDWECDNFKIELKVISLRSHCMEQQKIFLEHNFKLWYSLSQIRSIQVFLYIYADLIHFIFNFYGQIKF